MSNFSRILFHLLFIVQQRYQIILCDKIWTNTKKKNYLIFNRYENLNLKLHNSQSNLLITRSCPSVHHYGSFFLALLNMCEFKYISNTRPYWNIQKKLFYITPTYELDFYYIEWLDYVINYICFSRSTNQMKPHDLHHVKLIFFPFSKLSLSNIRFGIFLI